ncbi:MAG: ABC transporter ATP-binding protein [Treponemataceae bacterium]|nr:ABC transporter ATP-binding protein [Treponemataceae bacterium]MDE7391684.1 ABC transporter ATP-binding protein [Treponemataceae bacterium]
MIELTAFTKTYAAAPAVQDVSLVCREGTVTGLIGENGAGKTTILRAVCAQHFATAGTVRVQGIDAAEHPVAVRALTGLAGEQARLPAEYTVREFLSQTAHVHGVANCARAVGTVAEQCGIGDVLAQKIGTLSKGYRERVSFANALVHNPPVLVLDEPASGLDPAQIVRMRALIASLAKGRTILLSTHLMQEVDALCDAVLLIHKGRAVAYGTPDEIARAQHVATLEAAFFKLTQDGAHGGRA